MSFKFVNNPAVLVPGARSDDNKPKQGEAPQPTKATTDVYFWYFGNNAAPESINAPPSYSQSMPSVHKASTTNTESVVNVVDGRTMVQDADICNADSKYRGIVKLFLLYSGQITDNVVEDEAAWAMATGWLIQGDVVVTAGHCSYDYSRSLGRLIKVKVIVGYGSTNQAFRYGTAIATTDGWINKAGSEPSDVSFIKLNSPFSSSEVSKYFNMVATPLNDVGANLGVVGYPGDIVDNNGVRGANMYEMFKSTTYDLASADQHMLQYQIDTYGGNSGSPVLARKDSSDVIGVHVLGGYSYNSASVIDGNYGNRVHAYADIAKGLTDADHLPSNSSQPDKTNRPWLWVCPTVTTESDNDPVGAQLDECIRCAKTVVANTPTSIVDQGTPLSFGPTAGPRMSVLAAAAMATAGRLAADSVKETHAEALAQTRPYDGILGRAILAECCLQHFLDLGPGDQKPYREAMGQEVVALKPFFKKLAPKILRGIVEPAARVLLSSMAGAPESAYVRKTRSDEAEKDTGFGRKLSENEEAFLNELMKNVDSGQVEDFFSTLSTIGDVIGGAFKKGGPLILDAAAKGLGKLLTGGTEAGMLPQTSELDQVANRALLAEACLQTFVGVQESATRAKLCQKILGKLKTLGPIMMRSAPSVVKYVAPVVVDLLREVNDKKREEFAIQVGPFGVSW